MSAPKTKSSSATQVLFRGMLAKIFDDIRSVSSVSLAEDWTPEKTELLRDAIQAVIERNPILSGTLESRKGTDGEVETIVHYETSPIGSADYLVEIDAPTELPTLANLEAKDYQRYIHNHVLRLLPTHIGHHARTIKEECQEKSPIFGVYLVTLPDNFACYAMYMTHSIADGTAYYHIMEQIRSHMVTGTINTTINWDISDKVDQVSPRLMPPMARNLSAMVGSAVYKHYESRKQIDPKYILLSKSKINQKKKELKDESTPFLSTNDVVMTAIGQASLEHVDVLSMLTNARGRHPDILDKMDGGNMLGIIDLDARAAAQNPGIVRRAVESQQHYKNKCPPVLSMLRGRFMQITNWAGLTQTLEGSVAHWTASAFCRRSPYHFGAIFEYDKDMLGLVVNCPLEIKEGQLLHEIMVQVQ